MDMQAPEDYQAESDCYTMQQAKKIMADPKRMERMKDHARMKAKEMQKMADGDHGDGAAEQMMNGYRKLP